MPGEEESKFPLGVLVYYGSESNYGLRLDRLDRVADA